MRTAVTIIATAGLALLAAACGGSAGSPGTSTQENGAIAWTHCMRSHGLSNLADETTNTIKIPSAQQLGVSSSQLQAAETACQHLLPNGGQPPTQAEVQQQLDGMRSFSHCMRSHGIPSWPDPTIGANGKPGFDLIGIRGIPDENSPQFQSAIHKCGRLVPKSVGGIPVRQP